VAAAASPAVLAKGELRQEAELFLALWAEQQGFQSTDKRGPRGLAPLQNTRRGNRIDQIKGKSAARFFLWF